jgi:hypothetical protein
MQSETVKINKSTKKINVPTTPNLTNIYFYARKGASLEEKDEMREPPKPKKEY